MQMLNQQEIAKLFGVTRITVYKWTKRGCPTLKAGKVIRFDPEEVKEWMRKNAADRRSEDEK